MYKYTKTIFNSRKRVCQQIFSRSSSNPPSPPPAITTFAGGLFMFSHIFPCPTIHGRFAHRLYRR
jgi:hypothetical protein